jgi:hypothetical protein
MITEHNPPTGNVNWFLLLIGLLLAGWALYPDDDVFYRISDAQSIWFQPAELDQHYPERITSRKWSFDFEPVEEKLTAVAVDAGGRLVISARTQELIQQILNSLDTRLPPENRQRVFLLMQKSVGGEAGAQLADLTFKYSQYIERMDQLEIQVGQMPSVVQTEGAVQGRDEWQHRQTLALQTQIFGPDVTQAMFGRKQVLADYLFARRRIQADAALTEPEKTRRLDQLKQDYDARLKVYEARDAAPEMAAGRKS